MASPNNRVALLQNCATDDVRGNVAQFDRLLADAVHEHGATTVMAPEAFAFIGAHEAKLAMAEPLPQGDWLLQHCADSAVRLGCHLLLGGFHERISGSDKTANTFVHIGPDGTVRASYRKIHLFDVDLADGTRLAESSNTLPGDRAVTSDLPWGRLGLSICYDLRFPRLYQRLRDMGAMALAVPSAFTATTGAAHWHSLLRARAIETQCYVLAAAQYGQHNPRRRSYGHSIIIDPWGQVLAEAPGDCEAVISADIEQEPVTSARAQIPCASHQREFT